MNMQSSLIVLLQGCLVMTRIDASAAYQYPDSYKVTDDVEDYEDGPPPPPPQEEPPSRVDYTKYFGGSISPIASSSSLQPSSGAFVQSLDFPPFFGSSFGSLDTLPLSSPSGSIYGLSSSPMRYGTAPGLNSSAKTSSHAGFVDPNPNNAFRSLFGGSSLQAAVPFLSVPSYQYLPQAQPSAYVQPSTFAQPSATYSLYLPNYQRVKDSVTRDVHKDQRQLSESTTQKTQDSKKHPKRKDDIDELYDKSKSTEDDEEDEDEEEDDDDEPYSFEDTDEKTKKPPAKDDSPLGKSSYPLKGGSYSSSYTDKPKKITKSESRSNTRQQSPSQGYSGAYDYPKPSSEDLKSDYNYDYNWYPSTPKTKESRTQLDSRPTTGYSSTSFPDVYNKQAKHSSPKSNPSSRPSYQRTVTSKPPYQAIGYHSNGNRQTYGYGPPSPVKNQKGFVPSANIPYANGFPRTNNNKKQYRMSYASAPSEVSQVRSREGYSSELVSDKKKCVKIEKNVSSDPSKTYGGYPMTCYKCHDEATGASSESCSYDTEKTRKSYQEVDPQTIKVEKTAKGPHSIRAKRESPYDFSFSQDTNIGESVSLVRKVRQYTEYDDTSDYDADENASDESHYRFGPEYFKEGSDEETKSSEYVPETEIGENCHKVTRKGVTCMVCEKETGGTYEQCSYASDPNSNSYSYGSSSRYGHGSSSQPRQNEQRKGQGRNNKQSEGRSKHSEKRNEKSEGRNKQSQRRNNKQQQPNRSRRFTDLHASNNLKRKVTLSRTVRQSPKIQNAARKKARHTSKTKGNDAQRETSDEDETYEIPDDFAESMDRIRKANNGIVGLDPFFYGSPEDTFASHEKNQKGNKNEDDEDEDEEASTASSNGSPTYEDYFSRLFPELRDKKPKSNREGDSDYDDSMNVEDGEESESQQPSKTLIPGFDFQSGFTDYFDEKGQNEDLEKVLGEFSQKDRSACKKVMKDKMTCYQCVDDKGMQHEECMFVAASEPKSKHLAYHEVKQFNLSPDEEAEKKPVNQLGNTKPLIFHSEAQQNADPNNGHYPDNEESLKMKRKTPQVEVDDEDYAENENSTVIQPEYADVNEDYDNSTSNESEDVDSQASENIDILKLHPKTSTGGPISKVMIHNQRFYQSTGSSTPENNDNLKRKKRRSTQEDLLAAADAYNRRDERGKSPEESEPAEDDEYYDDEDTDESNDERGKQKKQQKKPIKRKNYNPIPTDPPSFEVPEGPDGAYSMDLEPAYDTTLKITLPRYMLSRSEHEAVFDEVLASG